MKYIEKFNIIIYIFGGGYRDTDIEKTAKFKNKYALWNDQSKMLLWSIYH